MTNSIQKTQVFSNLPIETQKEIQKLIIDKYTEHLSIGDFIYNTSYGIGKIVDIKIKDHSESISESNIEIVIYYSDKSDQEEYKYSTYKLSEFFYYKNHKLESSVELFEKQVQELVSGQKTIEELIAEEFGSTDSNTTDLTILNKDTITSRRDEMIRKRNFTLSRYEKLQQELERKRSALYQYANEMREQIEKANKLIIQLELYLGIQETMEQIQVGRPADEKEPICFRQRILYMDVECGDPADDGLDFSNIEKFDEWLLSTHKYWKQKNYERLIPEQKCIAVFRVRESDKHYEENPFINDLINKDNRKTYIFIRNGENIYKIWTDLINIYDKLFPTQSELNKIVETLSDDDSWHSDKKRAENDLFGFKLHIIFLQGILERTTIFQNSQDLSLFDPSIHESGKIRFIYDDDKSQLLPTHIKPFGEWQLELNKQIEEGNRIFFFDKAFFKYVGYSYRAEEIENHLFKEWFKSKYSIPPAPDSGVYSILKEEKNNKFNGQETLYFKYKVKNKWNDDVRPQGFSWSIEKSDIWLINYDAITAKELETLEFYLYTRIGREGYLSYIPLLTELYNTRTEELEQEKLFIKLVLSQNKFDETTENENKVVELIDWWKLKNKWKRSLTIDDTKALRMISKELKK